MKKPNGENGERRRDSERECVVGMRARGSETTL